MIRNDSIQRANELLARMSLEEKLYQLTAQMIYSVDENYENNQPQTR